MMNEINTELYEKLARLQWLLHKHNLRAHAENGPMADPTRGQGRIFAILKMQDGISTKDLSYLLGIRVSSLNELLVKMEKNGYIIREQSEADKRVMLVKLTEKGRSEQQQEWNPEDIFSCLSEEEQKAFGEYLDRVITSLADAFGEEADEGEREWWKRGARERMGDEMFDRLAAMMQGGRRMGGFEPRDGFTSSGRFGQRHGFGGDPHGGYHGRPGTPPPPPTPPVSPYDPNDNDK